MEHAKKMMIVSPELFQRLTATSVTEDVHEKILGELDNDMQNVLKSELDDREKWTEYYQVLQRYLQFSNQIRKPIDIEGPILNKLPLADTEILDTIPKIYKRNAQCLVNILKRSENIEWDNKGIVSIKGETMPSSNIIDLINDVVRSRKTTNPVGSKPFVALLNDLNVPNELINSRRKDTFHSTNNSTANDNNNDEGNLQYVRDHGKKEDTISQTRKKLIKTKLSQPTYKTRSSRRTITNWEKFKF